MSKAAYGIPPDVYAAYDGLRQRSEGARYYMQQFTAQDVRQVILDRLLKRITDFVGI